MTQTVLKKNDPDPHVGLINICVHGHFYQPPRQDAFTGIIPVEPSAAPYGSWNERITAECYRPNVEAGNFDMMSFNLGPTLASWLEKAHPDVYKRIIEADQQHHNAMAQGYNHVILPLASERDKLTQVLWGVEDFRHRFGREPRGMWMAETAVDIETLDVMAQVGIQFTILSPCQAAQEIDLTQPYLVRLREGRTITVFFYNPLSGNVSYSDEATADANVFAHAYQTYVNRQKLEEGRAQITVIATDGELYGHHKPFRDQFLTHFLRRSARAYGFTVCSLERYLDAHPARVEAMIHEPSAWSCSHGVARWSIGCDCDGTSSVEQRAWKPAFRFALEHLHEEGNRLFEEYASYALKDPWAARNEYIGLRNGWDAPERFWEQHGIPSHLDIEHIQAALQLLEAQYYLQCSLTSCGFFFEDLDRIEPRNNIAFARRAISLFWQATGYDLQQDFIRDLQYACSWRTASTGADIYDSLPVVPANLLPPR